MRLDWSVQLRKPNANTWTLRDLDDEELATIIDALMNTQADTRAWRIADTIRRRVDDLKFRGVA